MSGPIALASGSPQQVNPVVGTLTFRIVNTVNAVARLGWGRTNSVAVPAVATPSPNTVLMQANEVLYLELPGDSFFNISSTHTAEISGGQGGAGG